MGNGRYINYVEMIGVLEAPFEFSEYDRDEAIYSSKLVIKRKSGIEDCIPVSINKKLLENVDEVILAGKIKIQGFIFCRTRNNKLLTTVRITEQILSQSEDVPDRNFVRIIGKICKIPQFSKKDIAVCKFMVAVKAEHQPRCFIPVIGWDNAAYAATYCNLKQLVNIKGKLRRSKIYVNLEDGTVEPRDVYEIYTRKLKKMVSND